MDPKPLTTSKYWNEIHKASRPQSDRRKSWIKQVARAILEAKVLDKYMSSYSDYLFWEQLLTKHVPFARGGKAIEIGSAPGDHLIVLHKKFGYELV